MRRALLSLFLILPFAALGVGACGGSAFDGSPGAGGSSTGSGGTSAVAGTGAGVAGQPAGGAIGVGGSTSTAGTTSSGGTVSAGGTTSGSGGSAGIDMQACVSNTDCEMVPAGCCGSCGAGPISNYTAINSKYDAQFANRCGAVACAPCGPVAFNPNDPTLYYVPTCQAGRCTVIDLHNTDVTACSTAADCTLRGGTSCCPGCAGTPVALNTKNEAELAKYVCGTEPSACDACAPIFPGYAADCMSGRCSVALGGTCTVEHPCPE